jgi:tetratricopeptide (TPR) repeat protein
VDRHTRKELKTDKFAVEVGETLEFLQEHKKQSIVIGVAIVVITLAAIGMYYYQRSQHSIRQEALREAVRVWDAQVGPDQNEFFVTFPTQEEKDTAIEESFSKLAADYAGSNESAIAKFYLGLSANRLGRADEAEKLLKEAVDSGRAPYDSQAAYSLAQMYVGQGKRDEAKTILEGLIAKPTTMVSKEQATIALARLLGKDNPDEARKLLEPLRTDRSAVSRAALTALGEISQEQQ